MSKTEEMERGSGKEFPACAAHAWVDLGFSTIPPLWAFSAFWFLVFYGCYHHTHCFDDGHRVYPPDDSTWAGIFFCIIPHLAGDVKAGMFQSYEAFKVLIAQTPTFDLLHLLLLHKLKSGVLVVDQATSKLVSRSHSPVFADPTCWFLQSPGYRQWILRPTPFVCNLLLRCPTSHAQIQIRD